MYYKGKYGGLGNYEPKPCVFYWLQTITNLCQLQQSLYANSWKKGHLDGISEWNWKSYGWYGKLVGK